MASLCMLWQIKLKVPFLFGQQFLEVLEINLHFTSIIFTIHNLYLSTFKKKIQIPFKLLHCCIG